MLFAWQVKPQVEAAPARPRDVLVVVDNSASQAGKPLQQARDILTAYAATLGANDRVSVWLANTPASTRALTKGYFAPNSEQIRDAAVALTDTEYGSGATDLKVALNKALKDLPPNDNRQQFVLFLGDGESAFNPLTEADRLALGSEMDRNNVFFFAVPLGLKVNPQNLHGLATITGGSVVRLQEDLTNPATRDQFIGRLTAAVATPVVKVKEFKFGEEIGEVYPSKLPPLRGDRTTLVMGKLAKPAATGVSLVVKGAVAGKAVALNFTEKLPAPQREHFFLNMMLDQWQEAPHKEAPAMLQSDRALALASTQVKLYKDEFLVQAVWAVRQSNFEDATNLYKAAQKIDPHDMEAAAGLVMIDRLKTGKITKADIERKINAEVDALKAAPNAAARTVIQEVVKQDPPVAAVAQPVNPPQAAADAIAEAAARRQVEEQRYRVLTDATIRRARQLLRTDPDTAYADLKRQRDEIMGYGAIGNGARTQMVADLEAVMREIFLKGTEIKRQAAAEREAVAITRQRLNEFDRMQDDEARTKNRIDQFRQLMKQARFELAYQEAQLMIQGRVVKGQSNTPATVASYISGQHATQLREWRELVRIREDRYLLTMMQTEKSGIPYPDEPPVHFPPAAVWRELTSLRREAYINSNLGPNPSESAKQLKSLVEDQEIQLDENTSINDVSLSELLSKLSKRYAVTFVIQTEQFVAEMYPGDIREAKATKLSATQLRGMKMGTFLDVVLMSMGATYIVRPDYIEITTFNRRLEEKVTRVFPVADLVIPIPSSVNQQTLQQNLQFQNAQLAIFGSVVGAANFQGFGGAFGQNQGQQFGQFQGQQFNALGMAGNLGAQALGMGGGQQQFMGQNQGFGGGFTGVGGGSSASSVTWAVSSASRAATEPPAFEPDRGDGRQGRVGAGTNAAAQPGMDMDLPQLAFKQLNSLGYYPPARALIIRGTTRYHPAASVKFPIAAGGGQAAAQPNPRVNGGGAVVIGPGGENNNNAVAAAGTKPTITDPKLDHVALEKKLSEDPRRRWSEAIAWTNIDPGLIVASAEFLMEMNEAASAAEVLKGALRKGLTTDDWVHDSLAVALQAAGAGRRGRAGRGVRHRPGAGQRPGVPEERGPRPTCRTTRRPSPSQPPPRSPGSTDGLRQRDGVRRVRDRGEDRRRDLGREQPVQRDWNTNDGVDYHAKAKQRLEKIVAKVTGPARTPTTSSALTEQNQRDLGDRTEVSGRPTRSGRRGAGRLDLLGDSEADDGRRRAAGRPARTGQRPREIYTAATAFKGTYTVSVKEAFRKPIGGTAQLHVWKYKGTPKESYDLITVDMKNPKPIEIKLENGSRTDLATISEDADEFRASTTGAALPGNATGLGGGFGTAGSLMTAPTTGTSSSSLPIVNAATETRLPGIGAGAADLRASFKVNPDRQSYSVHVNPVFGTGKAVTMPKVALIPGGE